MRDGFIRVGCANYNVVLTNVKENTKQIIEYINKAYENHVHVLTFPELCMTGYSIEDLVFQKRLLNEVYHQLNYIVDATVDKNMVVVVGAPLIHLNKLYDCAVVISDGEILGVVPKTNIPMYHASYDGRHFAPALKNTTEILINDDYYPFGSELIFEDVNHEHLKIAIELSEDLWVPIPPSSKHCLNGATLICNPSASSEQVNRAAHRRETVSSHSSRLTCAYALCNSGVGESTTDVVFSNHHLIAENGNILEESVLYEEGLIYADVDLEKIVTERLEYNTYANNEDDYTYISFALEDEELNLERTYAKYPFVPKDPSLRASRCKEILDIQVHGLIQRIKATYTKKVVVGISGGLDSTLALLVCSMAYQKLGYPASDIIAVTMPCFGTTSRTLNNALEMMKELNVTSLTVNIAAAVSQHFKDINHDPNVHDVTFENAQARERTQVLMDIANQEGGLVIGTGDLSEVALGWATYNGDHMSSYGVNCTIPKTLVRYLVDYVSSLYAGQPLERVLQDILDTPVSPELIPAKDDEIVQKTEDIVGPYELHDFFIYHHVRFHYEPKKLFRITKIAYGKKYSDAEIKKWLTLFYRRFFTQQFKRSCVPDGVKVGSVALSPRGDLRMPSDSNVQAWLKECEKL